MLASVSSGAKEDVAVTDGTGTGLTAVASRAALALAGGCKRYRLDCLAFLRPRRHGSWTAGIHATQGMSGCDSGGCGR